MVRLTCSTVLPRWPHAVESRKLASGCRVLLQNERNHGDQHCRFIGNDAGNDADAMGTSAEAAERPDLSQRLMPLSGLFLACVRMIDSGSRESMAIYFLTVR